MEVTAYLGLGSNLGDRAGQIREALRRLHSTGAVRVRRVSSLYESEPVGWTGGPWYLNAVAEVGTSLSPKSLLKAAKQVEREMGRAPAARNAPRPIDVDIVLYNAETVAEEDLVVPHPRVLERAFVLEPLAEIAPEVEIRPGLSATEARDQLTEPEAIRLWTGPEALGTEAPGPEMLGAEGTP